MEPQRESRATMTDLIDRVMDKGVVVKLDLIIGMAGIPLIGISLHAAIAAIETMLEYGMMEAWDSQTRAVENHRPEWRQPALRPGEQVLLELYGSYHQTEGIWHAWRPGRLLLTDQRLLLIRPLPQAVLFAAEVSAIAGVGRVSWENMAGSRRDVTCLALEDGTLAALYTAEADVLAARLSEQFGRLGRTVTELSAADVGSLGLAAVAAGQLWHRWLPGDGQPEWKSGWAVLTADELTWRADVGPGVLLRVPVAQLRNLAVERRDLGNLGARDVLIVGYAAPGRQAEALFTGENVSDWPEAIRRVADPGEGDADA
jgi:Gas vesicle protein